MVLDGLWSRGWRPDGAAHQQGSASSKHAPCAEPEYMRSSFFSLENQKQKTFALNLSKCVSIKGELTHAENTIHTEKSKLAPSSLAEKQLDS